MAKQEAVSDSKDGWVHFPLESPASGSTVGWSLSQVSGTRPEAAIPAVPHIKVQHANVVYNIVVPGGEVDKILNLLENHNQSDCGPINKRRSMSPTKRTEDAERYSTTRRHDRDEHRRLQRLHDRRSEYSARDSGYAHRSRRRSWQNHRKNVFKEDT